MREKARSGAIIPQIASFAMVGLVAGIADYSLMITLREAFLVDAVTAALGGYVLGSTVSYLLNRMNTFKTDRSHVAATWRFVAVNVIGFAATAGLMKALVDGLGLNYVVARLVTTGAVFVLNFSSHRFWTFAHSSAAR